MNKSITELIIIFMFYSFIGYFLEVLGKSIEKQKLVNRGFLCGPYLPIYGIGVLFIIFTLLRFREDLVTVFFLGAIITSALEYFTSFVLEKIFHNKWWDYSRYKYQINGRVCLQNSILFGIGAIAVVCLDPFISELLTKASDKVLNIAAIVLTIIFIIDCIYSFIVAYNLRNRIIICEELKAQKISKIPGMLEKLIKERVKNFKTYPKRLLEAFPNLKKGNSKEFELMKKLRDKNKKKKKNKRKK